MQNIPANSAPEDRPKRCLACRDRNKLCECPAGPTNNPEEASNRTKNRQVGHSLQRKPPCPTCGEIADHDDHSPFGAPVR